MRFLPHDEKIFDLLFDQARIVLNASNLLAKELGDGTGQNGHQSTAPRVRDLEREGDEALRNIYRRLHQSFITPIDPEDIHLLAKLIDRILDYLDSAAYRFGCFGIQPSAEGLNEIARMVHGCVEATLDAVATLQREGVQKPNEITRYCEEINRRELAKEDWVREALRELFATERDPIELLKRKELYEILESTADCCADVADVLEGIAVKNS